MRTCELVSRQIWGFLFYIQLPCSLWKMMHYIWTNRLFYVHGWFLLRQVTVLSSAIQTKVSQTPLFLALVRETKHTHDLWITFAHFKRHVWVHVYSVCFYHKCTHILFHKISLTLTVLFHLFFSNYMYLSTQFLSFKLRNIMWRWGGL